jgi:hypothetical protein
VSTIYPKRRIRSTHVIDAEDFNANLLPFAEAAEGRLGEHNVAGDGFDATTGDRDLFSGNAGFHARKSVQDVDHTSINNATNSTAAANARSANAFEIPKTGTWAEVTGATLEFSTPGSLALISARALYWNTTDTNTATAGVSYPSEDPGLMIAIRVDGNLISESIMGSGELGNDTVNSGNSPGAVTADQDPFPVSTGTLEYLTPGRHSIELVCRLAGPQNDSSEFHFLLTRELTVLEIGVG